MIPSRQDRIRELANMAAADAHHDFDKGKRTGIAGLFSKIFNGNNGRGYHKIGTPDEPTDLEDEDEILDSFLHYSEPGRKPTVAAFREKYLNDVVQEVSRDSDDPIPYEVSAKMISSHRSGSHEKGPYTLSPSEFMDFLEPSHGNVAFCVDAVSVSFYDIFEVSDDGERRVAFFLTPREAINDGAGKKNLSKLARDTEEAEYSVQVVELQDSKIAPVEYPHTDMRSTVPTFSSIFDIQMTGIGYNHGKKCVSVRYANANADYTNIMTTVASEHDTSVKSLAASIRKIRLPAQANEYFVLLQQKRAGDWLQVLSCLDTSRFPEIGNAPIIFCTHDKICAAYAISMGVNVLFTHSWKKGSTTEQWVLYLRKKVEADTVDEEDRLQRRRDHLEALTQPLLEKGITYVEARNEFILQRDTLVTMDAINAAYSSLLSATDSTGVESAVRAIFNELLKIAHIRATLPNIRAEGEEALVTKEHMNLYESQLSRLKRIAEIKPYIERVIAQTGSSETQVFISKMSIFGRGGMSRFFNKSLDANITGIFSYLQLYLTEHECDALYDALERAAGVIPADKRDKYRAFLNLVKLMILGKGNGPKVPAWVLLQSVLPAWVLLQSVISGDAPPEDAAPEGAAPEGAAPEDAAPEGAAPEGANQRGGAAPTITLSASYAAEVILATQFQRFIEGYISDHEPTTSCILMLNTLRSEMERIDHEKQIDPTFEHFSEYMLKYFVQAIHALLTAPKDYTRIEKFILNDIIDSIYKDQQTISYQFIDTFFKDTYGIDYHSLEGPDIPPPKFVFQDAPFSELIATCIDHIRALMAEIVPVAPAPVSKAVLHSKYKALKSKAKSVKPKSTHHTRKKYTSTAFTQASRRAPRKSYRASVLRVLRPHGLSRTDEE